MHCTTRPRRKWSPFLFLCTRWCIYVFIFLGAIITPPAITTTVTTCSEIQFVPIPSPYIARVCGWGRILFPIPLARAVCHEFHDAPADVRSRGHSSPRDCDRRNCVRRHLSPKSTSILPTLAFVVRANSRSRCHRPFFFLRPALACNMWDKDITYVLAQFLLPVCVGQIFRKSIYICAQTVLRPIIIFDLETLFFFKFKRLRYTII